MPGGIDSKHSLPQMRTRQAEREIKRKERICLILAVSGSYHVVRDMASFFQEMLFMIWEGTRDFQASESFSKIFCLSAAKTRGG